MLVAIRPFLPGDWAHLLELANQAVPFAPQENAEWLEKRKAFDESRFTRRHYLALLDSVHMGYGCLEQQGDQPGSLRIYVVCSLAHLLGEVGALLFSHLLLDAHDLKTKSIWARELLEDEPIRAFFLRCGFSETQRVDLPGQRPMILYQLRME